jgi:hypothetical protein
MKKVELFIAANIVLAIVLKLQTVPGANEFTYISLIVLAILYFPFGIAQLHGIPFKDALKRSSYANIPLQQRLVALIAGFGLSCAVIGSMLKLQLIEDGNVVIMNGLGILLAVLVLGELGYRRSKSAFYRRVISRGAFIFAIGAIFTMTPTSTINGIVFRNHPEYVKAYELAKAQPDNPELERQKEIEYHRVVLPADEFDQYLRKIQAD